MKKLTQEEFKNKVDDVQENQYLILGEYKNKRSTIKVQCKNCGLIWEPTASLLLRSRIGKNCKHHINLKNDDVKKRISNATNGNIYMIGEYKGSKVKTDMVCNICGYKWSTEPYIVYSGHGCPRCRGKAPITNDSLEKYISENASDYSLVGIVSSSKELVEFKHRKYDHNFFMTPHNFILGQRCPLEASKRAGDTNSYSLEKMNSILYTATKNRYQIISEYKRANMNALCIDNQCGNKFYAHPGQLSRGETGCPICSSSKGEKAVREYLIQHKYSFKEQVKFDDCRNKGLLPFDFGVYDKNKLVYLIEYQGKQHYEEVPIFDSKDSLRQRQFRDSIKKAWCKEHDIKLIQIPYKRNTSSLDKIRKVVNEFLDNHMLIPNQAE